MTTHPAYDPLEAVADLSTLVVWLNPPVLGEAGRRARIADDRDTWCSDQAFDSIRGDTSDFDLSARAALPPYDDCSGGNEREHADVQEKDGNQKLDECEAAA